MAFVSLSTIPNFDPRQVPAVGSGSHLPAVPDNSLTADALRQRFKSSLQWAPEIREEPRFTDRAPTEAAVLVAIVMRERPTVLLTQRSANMSNHSGQIAFAGGKVDDSDANIEATALREAWEEVALEARFCEVLGSLPPYITGTAFTITPVVALVQPVFNLQPNPSEVADVFEVPLDFLMNPSHHVRHEMVWGNVQRQWFSMTWKEAQQERFIWGATAGMLRNLYRFLAV